MAEPINLAPMQVHAVSVPVRRPPNSIAGPDEMMLQLGENGGVQVDVFGRDAQGNELHESREMQEDEYEEMRKGYLRAELATMPPFSSFKSGNTIGRVVGETAPLAVPASQANPPIEAETEEEGITGEQILDGIQLGLDVVGLIPVVGEVADIASGIISLFRGDYVGAGLSLLSAIPFVGYAGTAGKLARRATNIADTAKKSEKAEEAATVTSKAGETSGKKPATAATDAPRKNTDTPGGKSTPKTPLKCGQRSTYGKLSDFDAASVKMERDHIPPQAALIQRAKDIALAKGVKLSPNQIESLAGKIERHGQAVSIPKEIHRSGVTNSNPNNRSASRDLQGIAHKEGASHRENMRRSDKNHRCLAALQKATGDIGKITNKQYDKFLEKLLTDTLSGKRTNNPWNGIL
ncbi:hypothetical protein [Pseudomonas khavaziana]|uniref:hypothetical protein n=1 Tax=Pseudomonas khavaziana TaxID=2842351 RepID=UPI001C3CC7B4|nr:hypothetical protein [Pseudomonas khavaziana]MBV4481521.1 hypothetical protein [Pseudomonas khavaziana]